MKSKTLKMGLISLIALTSFSCTLWQNLPAETHVSKNVVQFSKAKKPEKIGDLNSFSLVDPKYGTIVCFTADKAKKLRLYIDKQDEAIDEANVTIDNANSYIKQLNK
jgi:hypothetical protein